ncbi:MAG: PorP/SprF family type IX secretion system membrane protein [Adhaeribacter sp.]
MKKTNHIHRKGAGLVLALALALLGLAPAHAQLNPLGQAYFQNQYLANPALAGGQQGAQINLAYRQQMTGMAEAPQTQALTAQYGLGNLGFGVQVFNEEAGILKRTRALATAAYHLPVGTQGQKLSIGLSGGMMDQSIHSDNPEDMTDVSVTKFNDRGAYFDGDLGLAFTGRKLTLQAALPNVRSLRQEYQAGNLINQPRFFAAISYKTKLNLSEGVNPLGVEPKLVYRDIDGFKSLVDFGANWTFLQEKVNLVTLYHSTQSVTLGLGARYKSLGLSALHTTKSHDLKGQEQSNFEIGLQYAFGQE